MEDLLAPINHSPLQVIKIEYKKIAMELAIPFVTSFGREEIINKIFPIITFQTISGEKIIGIGECPTNIAPWLDGTTDETDIIILKKYIRPALLNKKHSFTNVYEFRQPYEWIVGNEIAKFGVEAAYWDALGKLLKKPVYKLWGGSNKKVETGTSVGLEDTDEMVLDKIKCAVEQKVKRVKIKIKPGRDVELIKKIRSNFPTLALQVDGNAAYKLESENHIKLLKSLDQYNLLMIEQPGPNDDRFYHAKLSHLITTPICLDESILHLRHVKEAIALWKNDSSTKRLIINIKPARVGGFWEAIQIAHLCKKEKIKTWCGGMLETALGKLANLHFNAATELSLPGDHVSQKPYYINDVMKPIAAVEGILTVPDEVGWGYNKATEQFFTA